MKPSDSGPLEWRAIQDSNLWPSAPEGATAGAQPFQTVPNPAESVVPAGLEASQRSQGFTAVRRRSAGLSAGPNQTHLAGGARPVLRVVEGGKAGLLTVRAAAALLRVSTATVYKLVARGDLAHVRVSNAIRIAPADLEAFLAGHGGQS